MIKSEYITILIGGLILTSLVNCSSGASLAPGNAGATSRPLAPASAAIVSTVTLAPGQSLGVESPPLAAGTRLWTAVPITRALPGDTQEIPTMSGTPVSTPFDPALQQLVMQAQQDLARRLSVPVEQIQLEKVQSMTWPDKGLGCPQPGMIYTQVQVDGLLIRFRAGGRVYEYHSGGNRAPFLCEQAAGKPGDETLAPPPGLGTQ